MIALRTTVLRSTLLLLTVAACSEPALAPADPDASRLVITPGQARLAAVGDTTRLRAGLYDLDGNLVDDVVTWSSADPDVFSIDNSGLVTGKQALSIGRAIATASGLTDTAYVVVANPAASPCLGYASPITLAVGQVSTVSLADASCITSSGGGDEYVVIPWLGTGDGFASLPLEVTGTGLAAPAFSPSRSPLANAAPFGLPQGGARIPIELRRDQRFERSLRELSARELMPLAHKARGTMESRSQLAPNTTIIPAYLAIGDLVQLNANGESACTSPVMRTGRVVAISARAIVVADTGNPAGGFTATDYQRFASGYDTLVASVEDAAFGAPTDIDVNGKVVIFFTRAVNALTPAGSHTFVAGYFHARDLLPQFYQGLPYCPASNEREMFYMPVPDPNGVVNGNALTTGFVDSLTLGTLAHENQHLVNFARRAYVNDALVDEEPWLNEGLSHIAEELVFYRAVGLAPRSNIGAERFGSQPFNGLFAMYMASNFARLGLFLERPDSISPYSSYDDLGTRGAIWGFLRYAADQRGATDGDVWMRLVNSPVSGFENLFDVFGPTFPDLLDHWSVALYTDDATPSVAAAFTQPSWNFRSAFPALPMGARAYPLASAVLADAVSSRVSLRGGSSAFFRFSIASGREAAIVVTSDGRVPPPWLRATIVRTR
jgi:hypothetical protein